MLIEVVGSDDLGLLEAGLVQHATGLDGEIGQVAGVQPDRVQRSAARPQPLARLDGPTDAGERVVCIHEQRDIVRLCVGVGIEGGLLIAEDLHPGVGVRAANRDSVEASGQHVGRGRHAPDVCGARCGDGAVGALGAP